MPAASVHAAVTSPPYWAVRRYAGGRGLGNERTPEEYVERLVAILDRVARVLRPDGSLWLNLGDTYAGKGLVGVPWRVALALQARGWIVRNAVVWDKVKGNPCNARDRLRDMYEHVFHLVRSPRFHYDGDAIRAPPRPPAVRSDGAVVTPTGVSGVRYRRQIAASALSPAEKRSAVEALEEALRKVRDGRMPDFRMILRGVQRATHGDDVEFSGRAGELARKGWAILPYHPRGSKPGDVWRIVPEDAWRKDAHAAVFPAELCRIPILATCPPGGVVLDPFAGTGTTLVAALALGRRAVGVDVSSEYLAVAERRLQGLHGT
jgi:DNA modification methylase